MNSGIFTDNEPFGPFITTLEAFVSISTPFGTETGILPSLDIGIKF
jgi:hypothetical protein